jgi:protein SCO1/2
MNESRGAVRPRVAAALVIVTGRLALMVAVVGGGLILQARGQAGGPAPDAPGRLIEIAGARALIPDAKVVDQSGREARLYTDLIKDRVVLLSFFYTTCAYVCPAQGSVLAKTQDLLGPRLGQDVALISITMDPARDTPQRLGDWARAFSARPGWTLVGGDTPELRAMIEAFTGNRPGPKETHFTFVFIGNDRTGAWVAADGESRPSELVALLDKVAAGGAPTRR